MAKQPLDLYRLFKLVVERGGLVEVREIVCRFCLCINRYFGGGLIIGKDKYL